MEEFALIKSRVNLDRVNEALALIPDMKVLCNSKDIKRKVGFLLSTVELWKYH